MKTFSIFRIYSDNNGHSHFAEAEFPLKSAGLIGKLSDAIEVKNLVFREVEPAYDWDFHTAPQRQFIVLLDGQIEIETSTGEKRTFSAGDILLVEDTTVKGNRTRNRIPEKRRSIFITL